MYIIKESSKFWQANVILYRVSSNGNKTIEKNVKANIEFDKVKNFIIVTDIKTNKEIFSYTKKDIDSIEYGKNTLELKLTNGKNLTVYQKS